MESFRQQRSQLHDIYQHLFRNRIAMAGLLIVLLLLCMAIQTFNDKRMPPGTTYLLGADEFGRDILSRIIYGARVALFVALVAVALALVLGVMIGLIAGFVGGWVDVILMCVVDIMLSFPYLLLAIAIVATLGTGIQNTTLAVGI